MSEPSPFRVTLLAQTGDQFESFAPYVPCVNDAGVVAFQAAMHSGGTVLVTHDQSAALQVLPLSWAGKAVQLHSHPDIDLEGTLVAYGTLAPDEHALVVVRAGRVFLLADTGGELAQMGPLGPTLNTLGVAAFRASLRTGGEGVFLGRFGRVTRIADTQRFLAFFGLPVIVADDTVVFRADDKSGAQSIYARSSRALEVVARTGDQFHSLGSFPSANDRGQVAFVATCAADDAGVFVSEAGRAREVQALRHGFESFRGALISNSGAVFFYATPEGGTLGVYVVLDGVSHRVLSIGDEFMSSVIAEFALNPVSINNRDQLAVRLRLENGVQCIVRVDGRAL